MTDRFVDRHIGPRERDLPAMLEAVGAASLDALIDETLPRSIRAARPLDLPPPRSETEALDELAELAGRNERWRSYLGLGYAGCITPSVIRRTIFENPGWYTAYTPYQAEISQGRLEALLNFQTMVADLTGFGIANASLLDEATAAAEAMTLCARIRRRLPESPTFFASEDCHPQTLAVLRTRAEAAGFRLEIGDHESFAFRDDVFGALIGYPTGDGRVLDYRAFCERAHEKGALVVAACDLLALTLLTPPGEWGADIAIGNTQRFGVPLGYGGPHAAFMATAEKHQRQLPGRIVGVSKDSAGNPAVRMALQTREQHIRRDKATSNICTAQVLLAVMAAMYGVYHGPRGLRRIGLHVHKLTARLAAALRRAGYNLADAPFFDTLRVSDGPRDADAIHAAAAARRINLRRFEDGSIGVSLDETVGEPDLADLLEVFGAQPVPRGELGCGPLAEQSPLVRVSDFMTHPVFADYHSETEFMRYAHRLESRDLSLNTSMIALGSCTMKLNAATEMYPVSDPGFAALHPFCPPEQAQGYRELFERLERWLAEITGFAAVSLMPNSGAQGEYAGLLVIKAWQEARGEGERDLCLIPASAHGTNPASAVMAGMRVAVVRCDDYGNIDVEHLAELCEQHRDSLAALMVTYPSTHGVFEEGIRDICDRVHAAGGQVYLDGANMNAMVGLCRPGDFGADVCHLNLHKTFCIPHGGGGPGMGPIGVAEHLAPHLPGHPLSETGGEQPIGAVSAAPWGSASILPISYAYIAMMGTEGLTRATRIAILNANYVAARLADHFPLLYRGRNDRVAHECIFDMRPFKDSAGVTAEDIAKRLMDYGFHAPTMSFPVAGTLMVEPTESESKQELDRFCDAMISIREEIREIEDGRAPRENNLLLAAPHTAQQIAADDWDRPYGRERAAFPAPWQREGKFWPAVGRIDNAYGDRHLVCSCPPVEAFAETLD